MTITKTQTIDQITADESGNIMYREVTRIMDDGVEAACNFVVMFAPFLFVERNDRCTD